MTSGTIPATQNLPTVAAASPLADPLRVGVIGIGWAGQQHLNAYLAAPGVEVIALAAKEVDLLTALGAEHDIHRLFENWEDLLDEPGLDAVSVAVPTFLHAPIAIAALERGIHVLTEKPIARNAEEGQRMVDAAHAANRVLDVAFNHRRRGDIQALKQVIERGDLGRTYFARAAWQRRRGIPKLGSWFTNEKMAGGGPLADLGVHVLDYALHLLGEPEVVSVSAVTYAEFGPRNLGGTNRETADQSTSAFEVEDFAAAFLRLSDGGTLILEASWAGFRAIDDSIEFSVLGTEGGADLTISGATKTPAGALSIYTDREGEPADYTVEAEAGRGHVAVVEDFIVSVRAPSEWSVHDGSVGLGRARIIDACYKSARENREIVL